MYAFFISRIKVQHAPPRQMGARLGHTRNRRSRWVLALAWSLIATLWAIPAMGAAPETQPNSADQLDYLAGLSALRGHHYSEAATLFRKSAAAGNARAIWHLGALYRRGWGVPLSYRKMKALWQKASAAGDATATGTVYAMGWGVPRDYKKAMAYFRQAADAGSANAMCAVGVFYQHGWGVALNYHVAMSWYQKAAMGG